MTNGDCEYSWIFPWVNVITFAVKRLFSPVITTFQFIYACLFFFFFFFAEIDPKLAFKVRESNFACLCAGRRGKYFLKVLSSIFTEKMDLFIFGLLGFYLAILWVLEKVSQFSFTEETIQHAIWRICLSFWAWRTCLSLFLLVILGINLVFYK